MTFAKDVLESIRIWIGEKPLEECLGAEVGQSLCCKVYGNAECRTVEVAEKIHETIPADLIIKAGLVAVSEMVASEPSAIWYLLSVKYMDNPNIFGGSEKKHGGCP